MPKAKLFIPLIAFVLLAMALAAGFGLKDPHYLPSAMINQSVEPFKLAGLEDPNREITNDDLKGQVSMLNVWATWCPNCAVEHPEIKRIAQQEDIRVIGVNYNDERKKALKWLDRRGDPYEFNIYDDQGKLGINLGVYGAPETFIVDANGVVQHRHVGVVTRDVWENELKPLVQTLQARARQKGQQQTAMAEGGDNG